MVFLGVSAVSTSALDSAAQTTALKVTRIGGALGVILPQKVLARLKLEQGDSLFMTDAVHGVTLSTCNPAAAGQLPDKSPEQLPEQLRLGREFLHAWHDTFAQLAK